MKESRTFVYVGSMGNRENRGCGEGVSAFEFDGSTGAFRFVNLLEVEEPSVLAASPDGKYLYSTNEMSKFIDGLPGSGGGVTAMRIDPDNGAVSLINQVPSLGAIPAHICVNQTGAYVCASVHGALYALSRYVENEKGEYECRPEYDPTAVSLFKVREDGGLNPGCDLFVVDEPGHADACQRHPELANRGFPGVSLLSKRMLQLRTAIHSVNFNSNGLGVICERGADRIYLCRIDSENDRLQILNRYDAPLGSGPRHSAFHPTLPYLYITNEVESSVSVFHVNEDSAVIEPIQTIRTLNTGSTEKNSPADIHVDPLGRFVFASNRGTNSITVYQINADTGELQFVEVFYVGDPFPRGFDIDPTGNYMVVVCSDTNRIISLKIDPQTGRLRFSGQEAAVKSPVYAKIVVL